MKRTLIVLMSAVMLLPATGVFAQQPDNKGCKDHPLFPTRMPEYRISDCKVEDFGVYEFFAMKGPKTPVEGKFTFITYTYTGQRTNEPSGLAVVRNYENAIKKVGGTILQSDPAEVGEREDRQGRPGNVGRRPRRGTARSGCGSSRRKRWSRPSWRTRRPSATTSGPRATRRSTASISTPGSPPSSPSRRRPSGRSPSS